LIFNEKELKIWGDKRGAIYINEIPNIAAEELWNKLQRHLNEPRYAFMLNGDRIKYDKDQNIEEFFSSRYGYDYVPEKVLKEIKECNYSWDFYGRYFYLSDNFELEVGYRNNFFFMRSCGEWIFRLKEEDDY
jgi:hypothetical protein